MLCHLLEADGAEVVAFPTIRLVPPSDHGPVDRAIRRLAEYRWIVFTSQNGVVAFLSRMLALGHDSRLLRNARVAAIGPGTAGALRSRGVQVDLAPGEFRAEALVEAFAGENLRGAHVLLPRAEVARSVLPDGLRSLGATVDVVAVYRTEADHEHDPETRAQLLRGHIDAVTFTSSSTVRKFFEVLGGDASRVLRGALVACIGPVTAATARECGLDVGIVAETYTMSGLVFALRIALGSSGAASRGAARVARPPHRQDAGERT